MLTPEQNRRLKGLLRHGIPRTHRPWQTLAQQLGVQETEVFRTIRDWLNDGTIKRMGLVVNHHALGYTANAMVVFDVPDDQIREIAAAICSTGRVNLCYQRPRRPNWPYNLFCMIHGQSREHVKSELEALLKEAGLEKWHHEVLFSTRQFKQCGGHYGLVINAKGGQHD